MAPQLRVMDLLDKQVSDDLAWFTDAFLIAPTLQAALDDWERCEPALRGLAESLSHDAVPKGRFHERDAASPLPRRNASLRSLIRAGMSRRRRWTR